MTSEQKEKYNRINREEYHSNMNAIKSVFADKPTELTYNQIRYQRRREKALAYAKSHPQKKNPETARKSALKQKDMQEFGRVIRFVKADIINLI